MEVCIYSKKHRVGLEECGQMESKNGPTPKNMDKWTGNYGTGTVEIHDRQPLDFP